MKNIFPILTALMLTIISCKKEKENPIQVDYSVEDYYTGEPIPNLNMSFQVCSGSSSGDGWFFGANSCVTKYYATSDNNGKFQLNIEREDQEKILGLMDLHIPEGADSNNIHFKYHKEDGSFPSVGYGMPVLKIKPSARVKFPHPIRKNPNTTTDTIIIRTNSQEATATKYSEYSIPRIYLVPNKTYTISLEFVSNGISTFKTMTYTVPAILEFLTVDGGNIPDK